MQFTTVLVAAVCTFALVASTNPGVVVQINQSFLTLLKNSGLSAVESAIEGQALGSFSGSVSFAKYIISDLQVTDFTALESNTVLEPTGSNGILANLTSVSITLSANWEVYRYVWKTKISSKGSATIVAVSSSYAGFEFGEENQRPSLTASDCASSFDSVSITFSGTPISGLLNAFSTIFENIVKTQIGDVLCTQVTSVVADAFNGVLQELPVTTALGEEFFVDTSVTGAASVVGSSIEAPFLGKFYYEGHENDAGIPEAKVMAALSDIDEHLCVKVDLKGVIGSAAYALIVSDKLKITLTHQDLVELKVPELLDCDCNKYDFKCIVNLVPQLKKVCEATHSFDLSLSVTALPVITSSASGVAIQITGDASLTYNGEKEIDLQASVEIDIPSGGLTYDHGVVKAKLNAVAGKLSVVSENSKLGKIADKLLNALWDTTVGSVIQDELTKIGEKGFELPTIAHITGSETATFHYDSGSIAICDNVSLN